MYPYHNRIKQRIAAGELVRYEFVENYPNIGECMVLHFNTEPFIRPVRPRKYHEYVDILSEFNKKRPRPGDTGQEEKHKENRTCGNA